MLRPFNVFRSRSSSQPLRFGGVISELSESSCSQSVDIPTPAQNRTSPIPESPSLAEHNDPEEQESVSTIRAASEFPSSSPPHQQPTNPSQSPHVIAWNGDRQPSVQHRPTDPLLDPHRSRSRSLPQGIGYESESDRPIVQPEALEKGAADDRGQANELGPSRAKKWILTLVLLLLILAVILGAVLGTRNSHRKTTNLQVSSQPSSSAVSESKGTYPTTFATSNGPISGSFSAALGSSIESLTPSATTLSEAEASSLINTQTENITPAPSSSGSLSTESHVPISSTVQSSLTPSTLSATGSVQSSNEIISTVSDSAIPLYTAVSESGFSGSSLTGSAVTLDASAQTSAISSVASLSATSTATSSQVVGSSTPTWGSDPFQPPDPQPTIMRPDHPRLIAPAYKWSQLPTLIASNSYMKNWNDDIMSLANEWAALPPVSPYANDTGPSDIPRQVKMRIKKFAYAYRVTGNNTWLNRTWAELSNILSYAPPPTNPFGPPHFWQLPYSIDGYELTSALAIAYDWLFEAWSPDQRSQIVSMAIWAGISPALDDFGLGSSPVPAPWTGLPGQCNCIWNAGILMGLLSMWDALTEEVVVQLLNKSLESATAHCSSSVTSDGSWIETPTAWLAGTTAHAEMASSLLTATGSTYDMMHSNPDFEKTGFFHIYATGNQGLFNYGDTITNMYSVSGNAMLFYATQYANPVYMLYQRDRGDVPDPLSMFWYDPSAVGQFWSELPLDRYFEDPKDCWMSMRSSWMDTNGLFVAMKSGQLVGHSAMGDLDIGDFVLDALGVRWAIELGSDRFNATGYFGSEAQDSTRWLYYRKRTEGQNTILIGGSNQNVTASPGCSSESSNVTAFFSTDMSSAYGEGTSVLRGIRLLNGRRQVLLQDDISSPLGPIAWLMHTAAAVQINSAEAVLTANNQTMRIQIINPPDGAVFTMSDAVRQPYDPPLPPGSVDQPNTGITVLRITLPLAGTYNLQVLFDPQWPDMTADSYVVPPFVPVSGWSLRSHG